MTIDGSLQFKCIEGIFNNKKLGSLFTSGHPQSLLTVHKRNVMGPELPTSEPAPAIFYKAKFCQKENSKFNMKKLSAIGSFEPPQVRKERNKNCRIFLFFLVCSQKYRYLVCSPICLNLRYDDIKKILHPLLWMIAALATNENSLKKH